MLKINIWKENEQKERIPEKMIILINFMRNIKLKFFKLVSTDIEEIYDLMSTLRTKGSGLPISIKLKLNIQM